MLDHHSANSSNAGDAACASAGVTTPFRIQTRIYFEDTDCSGIVFNANYLKYCERARTEWLREKGIDQTALAGEFGAVVVVRRVTLDLARPARLDDLLWVEVEIEQVKQVSVSVRQTIRRQRDGEVLATADALLACLDASSFRPKAFPPAVRSLLVTQAQAA